jgi:hypothetical protein
MTEVEYEPLTDDQRAAVAECRYASLNMAHTWALLIDRDRTIFERLGIGALPYKRAEGLTEYEAQTTNPEIMELVGGRVS